MSLITNLSDMQMLYSLYYDRMTPDQRRELLDGIIQYRKLLKEQEALMERVRISKKLESMRGCEYKYKQFIREGLAYPNREERLERGLLAKQIKLLEGREYTYKILISNALQQERMNRLPQQMAGDGTYDPTFGAYDSLTHGVYGLEEFYYTDELPEQFHMENLIERLIP